MKRKTSTSQEVVNEFVLKEWGHFPSSESQRLARWASSANYQFRSTENSTLNIVNPVTKKSAAVVREIKNGNMKYYIVIEQNGKKDKLCFQKEFEAFLLRSVPLIDKLTGDNPEILNIKIAYLEDEKSH